MLDLEGDVRQHGVVELVAGSLAVGAIAAIIARSSDTHLLRREQRCTASAAGPAVSGKPGQLAVDACAPISALDERDTASSGRETRQMRISPSMPSLAEMADEFDASKSRLSRHSSREDGEQRRRTTSAPPCGLRDELPAVDATPLQSITPEVDENRATAAAQPPPSSPPPPPPPGDSGDSPSPSGPPPPPPSVLEQPTCFPPGRGAAAGSPPAHAACSPLSPRPVMHVSVPSPLRVASLESLDRVASFNFDSEECASRVADDDDMLAQRLRAPRCILDARDSATGSAGSGSDDEAGEWHDEWRELTSNLGKLM